MTFLREPLSEVSGIYIFSPPKPGAQKDYNADHLDLLFAAENKHFWFLSRKKRILSVFEKYVSKFDRCLEIGSGTGNVSQYLVNAGYDMTVGELHIQGLKYAQKYGLKKCYQFDLFDPPFENHFDVIAMFDVIEHLDEDQLALEKCHSVLRTGGGRIVLTVPAFNFLWSRDDTCGHKRRYTVKSLKQIVNKAGFDILLCRYFFSAIIPLLILRRFLRPDDGNHDKQDDLDFDTKINPFFNRLLLGVCYLENKMTSYIPNIPGGSIIMVAEKREYK